MTGATDVPTDVCGVRERQKQRHRLSPFPVCFSFVDTSKGNESKRNEYESERCPVLSWPGLYPEIVTQRPRYVRYFRHARWRRTRDSRKMTKTTRTRQARANRGGISATNERKQSRPAATPRPRRRRCERGGVISRRRRRRKGARTTTH